MFYNFQKPIFREFLTEGLWEVTKVLHYSPHTKSVFFISNEPDSRGRFIYHMNVETKKKSCLTCGNGVDFGKIQSTDNLHNVTNSECLYYDALVGKLTDWLLLHCLGKKKLYQTIYWNYVALSFLALKTSRFAWNHTRGCIVFMFC